MPAYGPLDKALHRLALGVGPVAELGFDLDQRLTRLDVEAARSERHVFVSGLARAGTTVLMRRFHASGVYRSLTYRDMPFVLAPNLWRRLNAGQRRPLAQAERAHGDRILVDADSPEALDEVFWRVFSGHEYLHADHLAPHSPEPATIERYVGYVAAILAAQDNGRRRYLSKNNNNVLRLPSIRAAFAHALILIPLRDPVAQAASLLRQHQRFSVLQREDRFTRDYMRWLGHHEFGLEHRPVRFAGAASDGDRDAIDYWLRVWIETYAWLDRHAPPDAVFVVYEDLCADPRVWEGLATLAEIDPGAGATEVFRAVDQARDASPCEHAADAHLLARATALYDELGRRARTALA